MVYEGLVKKNHLIVVVSGYGRFFFSLLNEKVNIIIEIVGRVELPVDFFYGTFCET